MRSIMQCCLLFQFALACIKMGKPELAQKAVFIGREEVISRSVARYYDTHSGRFIGEQPRLCQTWTVSGFLTFKDDFREPREGIVVVMGRGL